MKRKLIQVFVLVMLVIGSTTASATSQRVRQLLREVDDLWRGESSHAVMTMQVKTQHYARTLEMEAWSLGTERTLVRILKPLKEKGTATLKSGTTIYTYLPQTDRTIRLTSGMMMGSWMGSHFTNDDLVAESRMENDYEAEITFEGKRNGQDVIEFRLVPHRDAAVVWGKVELVMLRDGYIPVRETFYDEDMKVARTMTFEEVKNIGGRLRPAVMKMIPADKPDEYTMITYQQLEMNVKLQESFFSLANLKRF